MLDIELCKQLLKLEDNWHVANIEIDELAQRIDITVSYGTPRKKSLFRRAKTGPSPQETLTLRHLPFGSYRTYLHVSKPGTAGTNKSWHTGNSPFTHEMEARIVQTLNSCRSNTIAAGLLNITEAEASEISKRTGAGSEYHEPQVPPRVSAPVTADDVAEHQVSTHTRTLEHAEHIPEETHPDWPVEVIQTIPPPQLVVGVPAENHPGWTRLIAGEIRLDTHAVGLQMMMERIRQSVERNPSDTSSRAGIKILRQYFLKHQNRLQNEILQLSGVNAGAAYEPPVQMFAVPSVSHPNWRRLVMGEIFLHTGNVALQMLLERVRLSIERNPSESYQSAAVNLLRHFFIKHQSRLQDEIRTLGGQAAVPVISNVEETAATSLRVPPESHPGWQRLINGELEIKTDVVALKMMLERIRISISNNPSDASRLAGARMLRQYFLKYQNKHRAEIDQLLAA